MCASHANNILAIHWVVDKIPWTSKTLLGRVRSTTSEVMASLALDATYMSHFLGVEISLPYEMILHITENKAVLTLFVLIVTHALSVVELSI